MPLGGGQSVDSAGPEQPEGQAWALEEHEPWLERIRAHVGRGKQPRSDSTIAASRTCTRDRIYIYVDHARRLASLSSSATITSSLRLHHRCGVYRLPDNGLNTSSVVYSLSMLSKAFSPLSTDLEMPNICAE